MCVCVGVWVGGCGGVHCMGDVFICWVQYAMLVEFILIKFPAIGMGIIWQSIQIIITYVYVRMCTNEFMPGYMIMGEQVYQTKQHQIEEIHYKTSNSS